MYEFSDCEGEPLEQATENCHIIMVQNNVHTDDAWWYWLAMLAILVVFRLTALFVLRQKGASF